MCKSVPQIAVEVRRRSTSVGASRRASSTVSISSVLSPRQTTAFISFPFFLQTVLPKLCWALSSKNYRQPVLTLINTLLAVLPILKEGREAFLQNPFGRVGEL